MPFNFSHLSFLLLFLILKAEDKPVVDEKYERNATTPGLAHPSTLKLLPIRVAHLCMRSALLQKGNALCALGLQEKAREVYETVFPLLENEPRCARVDWERHSLYVNIGNTFSRDGDFELANEQYKIAENIGNDHLGEQGDGGSVHDGASMVNTAKRAKAFALMKAGKPDEAKALLKEVVAAEIELIANAQKKKADEAAAAAAEVEADAPKEITN